LGMSYTKADNHLKFSNNKLGDRSKVKSDFYTLIWTEPSSCLELSETCCTIIKSTAINFRMQVLDIL
ncbi:hypothetical protein, partial [Rickettsia sp. TH2014]|uniref:hypothetical protein n=1 Tax=Rickettsia sp. TH2014 TaxID=1967503 RepID=UPI001C477E24